MKLLNLFTVFAAVSAGPATADVELQMATDALESVCEILYSNKNSKGDGNGDTKRKTVTAMDVVYALRREGRTLYGFGG